MPRAESGSRGQEATRQWRRKVRRERRPETDAVDMALAAAVAVYRHVAEAHGSKRDVTRTTGMELMAINFLIAKGYAAEHAERQVRRRVRRLDAEKLVALVNGPAGGVANQGRFPPAM